MKLTKKEKQLCIDKWQWFYDNPSSINVFDLPIFNKIEYMKGFCPLCEKYYKCGDGWDFSCTSKKCPVVIKSKFACATENDLLSKWEDAKTFKTRKKYAGKLLEIMKSL